MHVVMMCCVLLFFFKQKTAYEMRISDWSSDVCSSDLWIMRAIWSAPPPVPAGTMNSTFLVGFHSALASLGPTRPRAKAPATSAADTTNGLSALCNMRFLPGLPATTETLAGFFFVVLRLQPIADRRRWYFIYSMMHTKPTA